MPSTRSLSLTPTCCLVCSLTVSLLANLAATAQDVCTTSSTPIHIIQGSGTASPLAGEEHTITGVVTADFHDDVIRGFFIQEEDANQDGDPLTSEGIFVFMGQNARPVGVGHVVQVTGTVKEHFDLTEIHEVTTLKDCGQRATVGAAVVTLPVPTKDYLERLEGMRVVFPQTLTVTESFLLGRAGELVLSAGGRLPQPTAVAPPGNLAKVQHEVNEHNRIILDDGSLAQNPETISYPPPGLSTIHTVRGGDQVTGLEGVLSYSWSGFRLGDQDTNAYRVHPTVTPTVVAANLRPTSPPAVGGSVKVTSVNLLNYFKTLDRHHPVCGPERNQDCRGANTEAEFTRQVDKTVNTLIALNADIIGVMELENHPENAALIDLVKQLNARLGTDRYAAVTEPVTLGSDAIRVAFIFRPATVRIAPGTTVAVLDSGVDPDFVDSKNRPTLAVTFQELASGERFTVVVNHFKSKGSSCNDLGDPDTGDGQGNCNLTRTRAARALARWLATDPTQSGDPDALIIGDLNSYALEDPITILENAGYLNLIRRFGGERAYSFVFDGQWGYLDHALASLSLVPTITGASEWPINADEPRVLDYNVEFKSNAQVESLYSNGPFRASDHDPILIGLDLTAPHP